MTPNAQGKAIMNTPTPRTDKEQWDAADFYAEKAELVVDADFARKLERELAATTDVLSALQDIVALSDKQDFWLPKNWLDCAKTAIAKAEGGTQ